MSEQLRSELQGPNADKVQIVKEIYVDLPLPTMHHGHLMGDVSTIPF